MKLMFASDIHGSALGAKKMLEAYSLSKAEKLVLLGDILYHGPRNPLPAAYEPQSVAELLNQIKNQIICVRGNCDAEIDGMLLNFPISSDTALIYAFGKTILASHGHLDKAFTIEKLSHGDIFVSGHTHIPLIKRENDILLLNPGSVSIPKGGFAPSYMLIDEERAVICDFDKNIIYEEKL